MGEKTQLPYHSPVLLIGPVSPTVRYRNSISISGFSDKKRNMLVIRVQHIGIVRLRTTIFSSASIYKKNFLANKGIGKAW